MIGVSSKGLYGLAAMHVLSHSINGRTMQVREIAAMTSLSHSYLEQLLSQLRKAGLLISVRGSNGGYKLSRPAYEITVLEIIESLEGSIFEMDKNVGSSIILESFWLDIQKRVQELFSLKLSDIDQSYQPFSYSI
ncbi:Rrf2 family transcriptional regulator [Sulfurimonas sp. HSL-1716]|uniref:RrF2 family transcriptional regulator n=1 Tax=Hydrocurvibacter sulfurireducens TaxID=3131937 RepID=UPI0031F86372